MDVNSVKSDFQFLGNRIVEFSIKTQNVNPGKINLESDIDYNITDIMEKDEKFVGRLDFIINIEGKTDDETPLSIKLIMEGCFIADKETIGIETFKDMIEKNGLIALSQISRAYIISATSLSGISPAIKLPMINVFSLIKNKNRQIGD